MGCTAEVREFLRWYARYQAPDGKVPCCVDRRGADRVSEHDSPGAFVYAVAEYYRYTHDVGFLHDMWPHVLGAVDYLAALREQSMGDDFKAPDKAAFHAILPASISHEGYAAYPVHSYWDDFFALRGLKDAADMARVVGGETQRALELLDALLADQRPQAWNQWSEILWRDREAPRFIGDMPHTWVGATFVRAVRMMLAYERESDQALVLAAGVPAAWATAEQGISVKRLPTYYGVL